MSPDGCRPNRKHVTMIKDKPQSGSLATRPMVLALALACGYGVTEPPVAPVLRDIATPQAGAPR